MKELLQARTSSTITFIISEYQLLQTQHDSLMRPVLRAVGLPFSVVSTGDFATDASFVSEGLARDVVAMFDLSQWLNELYTGRGLTPYGHDAVEVHPAVLELSAFDAGSPDGDTYGSMLEVISEAYNQWFSPPLKDILDKLGIQLCLNFAANLVGDGQVLPQAIYLGNIEYQSLLAIPTAEDDSSGNFYFILGAEDSESCMVDVRTTKMCALMPYPVAGPLDGSCFSSLFGIVGVKTKEMHAGMFSPDHGIYIPAGYRVDMRLPKGAVIFAVKVLKSTQSQEFSYPSVGPEDGTAVAFVDAEEDAVNVLKSTQSQGLSYPSVGPEDGTAVAFVDAEERLEDELEGGDEELQEDGDASDKSEEGEDESEEECYDKPWIKSCFYQHFPSPTPLFHRELLLTFIRVIYRRKTLIHHWDLMDGMLEDAPKNNVPSNPDAMVEDEDEDAPKNSDPSKPDAMVEDETTEDIPSKSGAAKGTEDPIVLLRKALPQLEQQTRTQSSDLQTVWELVGRPELMVCNTMGSMLKQEQQKMMGLSLLMRSLAMSTARKDGRDVLHKFTKPWHEVTRNYDELKDKIEIKKDTACRVVSYVLGLADAEAALESKERQWLGYFEDLFLLFVNKYYDVKRNPTDSTIGLKDSFEEFIKNRSQYILFILPPKGYEGIAKLWGSSVAILPSAHFSSDSFAICLLVPNVYKMNWGLVEEDTMGEKVLTMIASESRLGHTTPPLHRVLDIFFPRRRETHAYKVQFSTARKSLISTVNQAKYEMTAFQLMLKVLGVAAFTGSTGAGTGADMDLVHRLLSDAKSFVDDVVPTVKDMLTGKLPLPNYLAEGKMANYGCLECRLPFADVFVESCAGVLAASLCAACHGAICVTCFPNWGLLPIPTELQGVLLSTVVPVRFGDVKVGICPLCHLIYSVGRYYDRELAATLSHSATASSVTGGPLSPTTATNSGDGQDVGDVGETVWCTDIGAIVEGLAKLLFGDDGTDRDRLILSNVCVNCCGTNAYVSAPRREKGDIKTVSYPNLTSRSVTRCEYSITKKNSRGDCLSGAGLCQRGCKRSIEGTPICDACYMVAQRGRKFKGVSPERFGSSILRFPEYGFSAIDGKPLPEDDPRNRLLIVREILKKTGGILATPTVELPLDQLVTSKVSATAYATFSASVNALLRAAALKLVRISYSRLSPTRDVW